MSLKRNVIANYISQFYATLIGIIMVPIYVKYMGVEAYGLVGFFAMLQGWFQLLDIGLSPTMSRETARFQGGALDALRLRRLLRALEGVFVGIALLGSAVMLWGADFISTRWLKIEHLPLKEVYRAISLMAVIVALRWVCGLYRGALSGFERFVWLSGFNIFIATARFVLVIPFFIYFGTSPTIFFCYQLALAVIEVMMLVTQTYRILPKVAAGQWVPWHWAPLRGVLKFSLSIAFTSSLWVLVTQSDKLILSNILSLTDYAYFTLAVLVAGGVGIISGPLSITILPRLTKLHAEGHEVDLIRLYQNATQLVGVIAIPTALVLAFFAKQVLWAWTGNAEIVHKAAPVLTFYALGNGILALAAFPYYLQFAKGDLKLHRIGTTLFIATLLPSLFWTVSNYAINGPGYAWLGTNLIFFMFWTPIVHRRFGKALHAQWLRDLGGIVGLPVLGATLLYFIVNWPEGRLPVAFALAMVSLMLLVLAAASSSWVRSSIKLRWHAAFSKGIGQR